MINIKELAKKETIVAEIMDGREKGDTSDLIKNGKPVHINNFEACHITNKDNEEELVYAYTIEEEPKRFYFAGFVLKKIFDKIVYSCGGDLEEAYEEVRKQKLKALFGEKKTKSKNTVTTIKVLD